MGIRKPLVMTVTGNSHSVMVFDTPKKTLTRKALVVSYKGHKPKVTRRMRLLNGDAALIRIIAATSKYVGGNPKITVR